jgi:hypothetical protein
LHRVEEKDKVYNLPAGRECHATGDDNANKGKFIKKLNQ